MKRIRVKAVEGRVVRESRDGPFIPDDRYVQVTVTPYIKRLLDIHGDIVLEPAKKSVADAPPPPKAEAPAKATPAKG